MVRFVEMKGIYLDDTKSFGFYDTVTDTFISIDDIYVFDSVEEFDDIYTNSCGFDYYRLKSLVPPDWL